MHACWLPTVTTPGSRSVRLSPSRVMSSHSRLHSDAMHSPGWWERKRRPRRKAAADTLAMPLQLGVRVICKDVMRAAWVGVATFGDANDTHNAKPRVKENRQLRAALQTGTAQEQAPATTPPAAWPLALWGEGGGGLTSTGRGRAAPAARAPATRRGACRAAPPPACGRPSRRAPPRCLLGWIGWVCGGCHG